MSDIDIFHKLIKDSAKVPLVDNYGKKQVILTEPQHSNSSVTISGLPDNVIVIKADAFKSPDTVFAGSMGECKRADFVIAADANKKKVILCIEFKAWRKDRWKIVQQLKGAQCFVSYCREIGRTFWNRRDFLEGYEYRFVSIGHTGIPKRKTRIERKSGVHDRPDRMLKINSPGRLHFNHLAGTR
jgi:hypothetical protein